MEFNWRVGHLFGGPRNRLVLNTHALRILVVHLLVYIYIYIYIILTVNHWSCLMSVVLQFGTIRNSTVAIKDQWLLLKPELLWLLIYISYIYMCIFLNLHTVVRIQSRKKRQHLTNWIRWNKSDEFWNGAIKFLSDVFAAVVVAVA